MAMTITYDEFARVDIRGGTVVEVRGGIAEEGAAIEPDNADVRYALGLYLVRKHDYSEALDLLRRAHELMPDNARYAYVYAVALNSSGAAGDALALLEQTQGSTRRTAMS